MSKLTVKRSALWRPLSIERLRTCKYGKNGKISEYGRVGLDGNVVVKEERGFPYIVAWPDVRG